MPRIAGNAPLKRHAKLTIIDHGATVPRPRRSCQVKEEPGIVRVAVLTRVCFPYHGFGGAERHIFHLVKYLRKLDTQVSIYTAPPKPGWREDTFPFFRQPDAEVHFVKSRLLPLGRRRGTVILDRDINYPFMAARLGAIVGREVRLGRADIVYSQGIAGLGYGVRKRLGSVRAPLLYNPQGMEEFKTTNRSKHIAYAPLRFYARATARLADCVLASDECMVPEVESFLKPDFIKVLRNGVDIEECERMTMPAEQEALVKQFDLHETDCIGVTVSRLEENKGISVLLRSLKLLAGRERTERWKWFIVGGGPLAELHRQECREMGLDGKVVFLGRVGETVLHNLYELADIYALPSLYEGSSIATLEAMAHRCAVVASAVGGLPDKVEVGQSGFLTEPGSSEDLAAKIESLVADPEGRRKMAERASELAHGRFSWKTIASEADALFRELIERSKVRRA